MKSHHQDIRKLLREYPDGLTTYQITDRLKISCPDTVQNCLKNMPDAYIDRWIKTHGCRGQYSAIWCVVEVPENCPKPNNKRNTNDRDNEKQMQFAKLTAEALSIFGDFLEKGENNQNVKNTINGENYE